MDTTAEERADIYRAFYKSKPKGAINALMETDSSPDRLQYRGWGFQGAPDVSPDSFGVEVNGIYSVDHLALCERYLQECINAGVLVQMLPPGTPMKMGLALSERDGESEMVFKATKKAVISITLDTNGGPLPMRNVEFLFFIENIPEVLFSRPLLRSMSFYLDKNVMEVRDEFHGTDFSHVGFSGTVEDGTSSSTNLPSRLSLEPQNRSGHAEEIKEFHDEDYVNQDDISNPVAVTYDAGCMIDHFPSALFYRDGVHIDPLRVDDDPDPGADDPSTTMQALQARNKMPFLMVFQRTSMEN